MIDFLVELILELLLEGSLFISKNKKVSRFIRYPIIVMLIIFFLGVIGLIFYMGIYMLEESELIGWFFIFLSLFMLWTCVYKFRRIYLDKYDER